MHQLLHVADGLKWLGPMHVYSQWGMERMCGMITRTAKSRVAANRNMELTLLLTEQKHMLGYVLSDTDWLATKGNHFEQGSGGSSAGESETARSDDIEDADGNMSLAKAFAHRITMSRPENVRASIVTPRQRFCFAGRVVVRPLGSVERQRIREFMSRLPNYSKDHISGPTDMCIWRWCKFRDNHDNKKEDFKITSRSHKRANNLRNASVVAYRDSQGTRQYGEVQFFFHARLPSELGHSYNPSQPEDSDFDSEEERSGTILHHLAFIRKIQVVREKRLIRRTGHTGAQAVISAGAIESLIGGLKVGVEVYLTARFTSMLGGVK